MNKAQTFSWAAALCLAAVGGIGTFAVAQPKPNAGPGCDHDCPMHQAAELSDIKVEQTKQGAVIQLIAKRPEDVSKVQQYAQKMAAMLSDGSCPMHTGMHAGHGPMHKHAAPPATK